MLQRESASRPEGSRVATSVAAPAAPARRNPFVSLRHRNYRLLWTGTLFSSTGWWLQQSAINWLTYVVTGSPLLLGVVNGLQSAPLLVLAPLGGVAADRVDRKRLLVSTQLFLILVTAAFATLVVTGRAHIWNIALFVLLTGVAWAFNMPLRQSIVANIVPRDALMNALALNSAGFNATRIVGPSLAGLLIVAVGIAGNFYLQALMYVGVAAMVWQMQIPPRAGRGVTGSPWRNLVEGAAYVWQRPGLRAQMGLALVPVIVAMPYISLMPVFARDVLRVGPQGFGLLMAAPGVGAVIGTLALASLAGTRAKGTLLFLGLAGMGIALILFANCRVFPLSLALLIVIGASQMTFLTTNQTLLHLAIPDEFRGRVMGLYMLNQGLLPLGSLLIGTLADVWNAPAAVTLMAALLLTLTVLAWVLLPAMRQP